MDTHLTVIEEKTRCGDDSSQYAAAAEDAKTETDSER